LKIHNEFSVPLPPDQTWLVLNDIPRVASCVPGATLLGSDGPGAYLGTVAVRLGPVALSFKGRFVYKDVDEVARRVSAEATGSEQKARGTATASVVFVLNDVAGGTRVSVDTDLKLAGSIAQYARGGSLIESTAQVLMAQFAENLRSELDASPRGGATQTSAASPQPVSATARPAGPVKEISALTLMIRGITLALRRWLGGSRSQREHRSD